jgi:hypothetical protein
VRGWLIYGSLPRLVMGVGIVLGAVPSVFHYFNPRGRPFVFVFYATIVALWIAAFRWIFFRGGAEMLIRHPGLLNLPIREPWAVKALVALSLPAGIVGLLLMLLGQVPVPE